MTRTKTTRFDPAVRVTCFASRSYHFHCRFLNNWSFAFTEAEKECQSEDEGSDDSEDGLPPLERNLNHITLEESDTESE